MWKSLLFATLLCSVLLIAATSRSDNASPPANPPATPEPITGEPAVSAPGSESIVHEPFTPYGIGPGAPWAYSDLEPEEQVNADAGRDTTGWPAINNSYATAVAERAHQAAADAAAHQLGIGSALTGVVP